MKERKGDRCKGKEGSRNEEVSFKKTEIKVALAGARALGWYGHHARQLGAATTYHELTGAGAKALSQLKGSLRAQGCCRQVHETLISQARMRRNTQRPYANAREMILDSWGDCPLVYQLLITSCKRRKRPIRTLILPDVTSIVATRVSACVPYIIIHTIHPINKTKYKALISVHK